MNWLIVEDALRDQSGHWYEYIVTFTRGLRALGDCVTVLCDNKAKPFILEKFKAFPILPQSIWARMSDDSSIAKRLLRIPIHGIATFIAIRRFLGKHTIATSIGEPDLIFVPTVLVHHLIGWWMLLKSGSVPKGTRLLLFFPNLPIFLGDKDSWEWKRGASVKLKKCLLANLRDSVESGKVILGVETRTMQKAFQELIQMPVLFLPHPVSDMPRDLAIAGEPTFTENQEGDARPELADQNPKFGYDNSEPTPVHEFKSSDPAKPILFASYGSARWEKGTDILLEAIKKVLEQNPNIPAKFVFQWLGDFKDENGEKKTIDPWLKNHPKIEIVEHYFNEGEYDRRLAETDVIILPYRSPYRLRVSRVAIEAMINGIPAIVTGNTTLWSDFQQFGAAYSFDDGSTKGLTDAICRVVEEFQIISLRARERMAHAQRAFSVRKFRATLTKNYPFRKTSLAFSSSEPLRKTFYQGYAAGLKLRPLLVTGFPRSGKTSLSKILIQTNKFRLIHEPFSNFRGPNHRSAIVKNLQNTFTHIAANNAWQYQNDLSALVNYYTYSYRLAIDGGLTLKKLIKYLKTIFLDFGYQSRLPLIDDPFLVLSVPWLCKTLAWNVILMIRNPLDSVIERTRQGFGFNFNYFLNQRELMEGSLRAYASEILELANNQDQMSILLQNAYLWKYINFCILQYIGMFPEIIVLRFDQMKDSGFNLFANWINAQYNIDISNHFNLFKVYQTKTEYFISESQKSDIAKITQSVAQQLFVDC